MTTDGPTADPVKQRAMHKRIAVAAEAITNAADIPIPHVPKSEPTQRLIGTAGCAPQLCRLL